MRIYFFYMFKKCFIKWWKNSSKILLFGPVEDISRNLWDQSMVLGCIGQIYTSSEIYLMVSRFSDLSFISWFPLIRFVFIPNRKDGFFNFASAIVYFLFFLFKSCLFKFDEIYFIGADVLDWRYGNWSKIFTFIIRMNKYFAKKTKIVSFSFTQSYTPLIKKVLQKVANNILFFPRDSQSYNNIRAELWLKENIFLSSDFSFFNFHINTEHEVFDWLNSQKNTNRIVLFCPAKRPSIQNMDLFLNRSLSAFNSMKDVSVLIVCHDFEENNLSYCTYLNNQLIIPHFLLQERNVSLVRKATSYSDFAFSCLMHCSLGAVFNNVPLFLLDYSNKARPIFSDLNLEDKIVTDEFDFTNKISSFDSFLVQNTFSEMSLIRDAFLR